MSKPKSDERYLPLSLASKKYYYTSETLVQWVRRSHVHGIRHANKWWIGENSLKQYLKSIEDQD